jgi:DNA-binding MarR family transcriptional regulator
MEHLPLAALLSHTLVAYTIEFDNEFEHRMPHRTTRGGGSAGPWLVSLVMWSNCMQFIPDDGISIAELERRARTQTNLAGMQRWKYLEVTPDKMLRATPFGQKAQRLWQPLFAEVETRWLERFGAATFDELRSALVAAVEQFPVALPDCMPILGYGLVTVNPDTPWNQPPDAPEAIGQLTFPALLAKVLIAYAIDFEAESPVSLAIGANVLRLIDSAGVRVRDLPDRSGISKEAIAMCCGFLERRGDARVGADPSGSRFKTVTLTPRGQRARDSYERLTEAIESRWNERYGKACITRLRSCLERIVCAGEPEGSTLYAGLKPHPNGWRARVPASNRLPYFPTVLHRGGYPDGS